MKKIIIIILVIVIVLSSGIYAVYNNYQLGQELEFATHNLSIISYELADSIDSLQDKCSNSSSDRLFLFVHSFEEALKMTQSTFGSSGMPLREDVFNDWVTRLSKLWRKIVGLDVDEMKQLFQNEAEDLTELKGDLYHLTDCLNEFNDRYNEMSFWERCFTSWEKERDALSEQVKLSE